MSTAVIIIIKINNKISSSSPVTGELPQVELPLKSEVIAQSSIEDVRFSSIVYYRNLLGRMPPVKRLLTLSFSFAIPPTLTHSQPTHAHVDIHTPRYFVICEQRCIILRGLSTLERTCLWLIPPMLSGLLLPTKSQWLWSATTSR